jgi:hypothetical protein
MYSTHKFIHCAKLTPNFQLLKELKPTIEKLGFDIMLVDLYITKQNYIFAHIGNIIVENAIIAKIVKKYIFTNLYFKNTHFTPNIKSKGIEVFDFELVGHLGTNCNAAYYVAGAFEELRSYDPNKNTYYTPHVSGIFFYFHNEELAHRIAAQMKKDLRYSNITVGVQDDY